MSLSTNSTKTLYHLFANYVWQGPRTPLWWMNPQCPSNLQVKQQSFRFHCHQNIGSVPVLLFHTGTNVTLISTRQKFWIPTGRQHVKSQLRWCVICHRHNGNTKYLSLHYCHSSHLCFYSIHHHRHWFYWSTLCMEQSHQGEGKHLPVYLYHKPCHECLLRDVPSGHWSPPQIVVSGNAFAYQAISDKLWQLRASHRGTRGQKVYSGSLYQKACAPWVVGVRTSHSGTRERKVKFIPKHVHPGWWECLIKDVFKKFLGRARINTVVL